MITLLTRKALQMIYIIFGTHHHFERRYHLVAGRTIARRPE